MKLKTFEEYEPTFMDKIFNADLDGKEDAPMNMEVEENDEDRFAMKFYDLYHTMKEKLGVDKAKALLDKLKSKI